MDHEAPTFVGRRVGRLNARISVSVSAADGIGGLTVRYDENNHYDVELAGDEIIARGRIASMTSERRVPHPGGKVVLFAEARHPNESGAWNVTSDVIGLGYETAPAASAEEALEKFRENPFPLIITDIIMGGMSGLELLKQVKELLRQRHRLREGQPDDFQIHNLAELAQTSEESARVFTWLLGSIASVSLLVGGIGIMNIMLVSVTERTREIGILKALGATRQDILLQFLIEALALCMIGGLVGVAIGFGLGALVATFLPGFPPAHVPLWAVALSFGFCAAVGVIFGIIPAAKAAQLDPIDALLYE